MRTGHFDENSFTSFILSFWSNEEKYVPAVHGPGGAVAIFRAHGPREASIEIDRMFVYTRTG